MSENTKPNMKASFISSIDQEKGSLARHRKHQDLPASLLCFLVNMSVMSSFLHVRLNCVTGLHEKMRSVRYFIFVT